MQRNYNFFCFFSEAGYSRQTGILDFRHLWPNSFRIVFSHEIDAFKKVFCISKWTGNYSKFKDKLDDKKKYRCQELPRKIKFQIIQIII